MERDAEFRGSPLDERVDPDEVKAALRELRLAARVLLQNAEGCAVNHYGEDFHLHGEPGWLRDCRLTIEKAEAVIVKTEQQ
jgi:hypothetical protein